MGVIYITANVNTKPGICIASYRSQNKPDQIYSSLNSVPYSPSRVTFVLERVESETIDLHLRSPRKRTITKARKFLMTLNKTI